MKSWIQEDIFKTWTDAQKRLWDSLCSAVPLQPPVGVEAWRETYLKNLASWEAAVQRSLEQEAAWVEEWVRRVAQEKGTPEMMAAWVRQMEEVLQRWIQIQNQWWNDYFALLRRGGFVQPGQSGPAAPLRGQPVPSLTTPSAAHAQKPEAVAPAPFAPTPLAEEPEPAAVASASAHSAPQSESAAASRAAEPPVEQQSASAVNPAPQAPDDLKLINGVGPAMEKKLNACGVFGFRDLALLSDADIERVEAAIKFVGRLRREDWMGQAKARYLQKYGHPV